MKVSWDDVGNTTQPGLYAIAGETVNVAVKDIEVWKNNPQAIFTANWYQPGNNGRGCYMLGKHEA